MFPIPLKTTDGINIFNILMRQFKLHKSEDKLESFHEFCEKLFYETDEDLTFFLEDETMVKRYKLDSEDVSGWNMYNELSDCYSVYNYFRKKDI